MNPETSQANYQVHMGLKKVMVGLNALLIVIGKCVTCLLTS